MALTSLEDQESGPLETRVGPIPFFSFLLPPSTSPSAPHPVRKEPQRMPFRMPPTTSTATVRPSPFARSESTGPPTSSAATPSATSTPTIRLPGPPLPPKPLHLTVSRRTSSRFEDQDRGTNNRRSDESSTSATRSNKRGQLPRWSGFEQEENSTGGGEGKVISKDEEEPTMAELLAGDSRRGKARSGSQDVGTYKSAVETLRVASGEQARDGSDGRGGSTIKRKSIYFDPTNENPFVPPSIPSIRGMTGDAQEEVPREMSVAEESSKAEVVNDPEDSASILPAVPPPCSGSLPPQAPRIDEGSLLLELPPTSQPAVSLHSFSGETSFGELSFSPGIALVIEVEDLGGGWSLGYLREVGEEGRGLIPRGWYAYIDLPSSPGLSKSAEAESTATEETAEALQAEVIQSPTSSMRSKLSSPTASVLSENLDSFAERSTAEAAQGLAADLPASQPPFSATSTPSESFDVVAPSPPSVSDSSRDDGSYATRSIGRHLVVSGAEFEPVKLTNGGGGNVLESDQSDLSPGPDEVQSEEASMVELLGRSAESKKREEGEVKASDVATSVPDLPTSETGSNGEADGLASSSPTPVNEMSSSPEVGTWTASPIASSVPQYAKPSSQGSILYRLGLVSSESPAGSPRSYLLGGLSIPGASVLAQSHPRRPVSPPLEFKRPRMSRSPGVMSGKGYVMEWIKNGDAMDEEIGEDVQTWDVDTGPVWRNVSEPFVVRVHSPRKFSPLGGTPFTSFSLTTYFFLSDLHTLDTAPHSGDREETPTALTVSRRFSHFVSLHQLLVSRYSLLTIPPLPPKAFGAARFSEEFVEERRSDLERWVEKVGGHPVLRESEEVRGFLSFEDDKDLRSLLSTSSSVPSAPLFFARVFHPEFNIDLSEAVEVGERFERHVRAIESGGGMRDVETAVKDLRESFRGNGNSVLALAGSLIRLVAGLALPPSSYDPSPARDETRQRSEGDDATRSRRRAKDWRVQNEDGAMTWKDEDSDALALSKAIQATGEALAEMSQSIDVTARQGLVTAQIGLQELARPATGHANLISTHKEVVAEYRRLSRLSSLEREDQAEQLSRCETVLNITCAEMDHVRLERAATLRAFMKVLLDAQIEEKERSLEQLRFARDHFEDESFSLLALTGPRLRSPLESGSPAVPYPALSTPRSFLVPQSTSSAVRGVIGSTLLRRSSTQTSEARTLVQSQTEAFDEGDEGRSEQSEQESERVEDARGTSWRESVFGTVKIW